MRFISIVMGCYNEQENLSEVYERVTRVMEERLPHYAYEILVIDNASTDASVDVLRAICAKDKRVKVIVNTRNFGHIRSPYHALLNAGGEAAIYMASDLQDPPEMIPEFVEKWEAGYKIVLAQKTNSQESHLFWLVRSVYYHLVTSLSEVELVKNATGFGLYDRVVLEKIREIGDPYPYLRGLICELGYSRALVPFEQPTRKRGLTKNNLYTLYDIAILGITNHSKVPLRLATFFGFCLGTLSFLLAFAYLVYKLLFWSSFQLGTAPVVVGIFFFSAVQLFFIGLLGEYIGSIHTQVLRRPPVVERERINFAEDVGNIDESCEAGMPVGAQR